MKHIIRLIVCFSLFGAVDLSAQPKQLPDSIRIEIPDHRAIVTIELRKYSSDKSILTDFPKELKQLVDKIKSSLSESDRSTPKVVEVNYSTDQDAPYDYSLIMKDQTDPSTNVKVNNESVVELLPPGWDMVIRSAKSSITIYVPDINRLEELTTVDFNPVVSFLDVHPETIRHERMGIISRLILQQGKVESAQVSHRYPYDMLGLHAGVGVGLLQDKWYPEFNFTTAFYFSNRYRKNVQRIAAMYELKVFPARSTEGAYLIEPTSFISLSYGLNFSKERPRWNAFGMGLMVHNRSDLFTGKTMKLFFETDIGNPKLNIIPEFYLTEDYKKSLFGIKLTYKF